MDDAIGSGLHSLLHPTYLQLLGALDNWLIKAQSQLGGEADAIMAAKLAPDMFPLSTQVRFCCVQAMEGMARVQGVPFPRAVTDLLEEGRNAGAQPGTIAEARARLQETIAWLERQNADAACTGANDPITHELPNGMVFDFSGLQYARDWALPQFNFHLMIAYAIMRHEGVELGKFDYVAHLVPSLRQETAPG